jgi:hypothetical protein
MKARLDAALAFSPLCPGFVFGYKNRTVERLGGGPEAVHTSKGGSE